MEIKRDMSRLVSLKAVRNVLVLLAFVSCLGCVSMARIDGPYRGRVVDAETERPIAGAVIHGTWSKVALGGHQDITTVMRCSRIVMVSSRYPEKDLCFYQR